MKAAICQLFRALEDTASGFLAPMAANLTGRGYGVHWPDVDEDLSAKSLALGKPSIEFLKQQGRITLAGSSS